MSDVSELSTQRALGQLEGTVTGYGVRLASVESKVDGIDSKLDTMLQYAAQQRGSRKTIVWAAGAAGSIVSALLTGAVEYFRSKHG